MTALFGTDSGLAHFGYASVALHSQGEEVLDLGVFESKKSDAKRKVLAADDNVRRGRELYRFLRGVIPGDTRAACAESMSHPQHASAAAKLSLSWGVLIGLLESREMPLLQASPQEIKLAVAGKRDASKQEVEAALALRYGPVLAQKLDERRVARSKREHAYDALAAIVACLESDLVRMLRGSLR